MLTPEGPLSTDIVRRNSTSPPHWQQLQVVGLPLQVVAQQVVAEVVAQQVVAQRQPGQLAQPQPHHLTAQQVVELQVVEVVAQVRLRVMQCQYGACKRYR